jgi:hypothetical protein
MTGIGYVGNVTHWSREGRAIIVGSISGNAGWCHEHDGCVGLPVFFQPDDDVHVIASQTELLGDARRNDRAGREFSHREFICGLDRGSGSHPGMVIPVGLGCSSWTSLGGG